jgi:hypothetical protein
VLLQLDVALILRTLFLTLLVLVMCVRLFPHPSPEFLEHIFGNVEGGLFVKPIKCSLEVNQASMGCFLEEAECCGRIEAPLYEPLCSPSARQ